MPKEKTAFNDADLWLIYCGDLVNESPPATQKEFTRRVNPALADMMDRIEAGIPRNVLGAFKDVPFNGDAFAEGRTAIARASSIFKKVSTLKTPGAKLKHLAVAEKWAACPHPWAGPKTHREQEKLLAKIRREVARQEAKAARA